MGDFFAFWRIVSLCAFLCFSITVNSQTGLDRSVGRMIGNAFLLQLTNPERTEFRVGIANVSLGSGMLVSPKGAPAVVEFLRGYDSLRGTTWFLWASAVEQLELSDVDEFRFEVVRWIVDSQSCPALSDAVLSFYSELEGALATEITLSNLPEKRTPNEITVDGTTFPVQIWTDENHVTFTPDRDINRVLHEASGSLHQVVSACTNDVDGVVEEHYF